MDCKSFPGKPRTVRVYQILENQTSDVWQPAIVVEWEHPEFGKWVQPQVITAGDSWEFHPPSLFF